MDDLGQIMDDLGQIISCHNRSQENHYGAELRLEYKDVKGESLCHSREFSVALSKDGFIVRCYGPGNIVGLSVHWPTILKNAGIDPVRFVTSEHEYESLDGEEYYFDVPIADRLDFAEKDAVSKVFMGAIYALEEKYNVRISFL